MGLYGSSSRYHFEGPAGENVMMMMVMMMMMMMMMVIQYVSVWLFFQVPL